MLKTVELPQRRLEEYVPFIGEEVAEGLYQLGHELKGLRVLHINATAKGGGVAELLGAYVGLSNSIGLQAQWQAVQASDSFFSITKRLHNALQGAPDVIQPHEWEIYEHFNREFAKGIKLGDWDVIFVHDPQPAAIRQSFFGVDKPLWLWRCHIDTSHPHPRIRKEFSKYLHGYKGAVYSLQQYIMSNDAIGHSLVSPVAIDPLSEKNTRMELVHAKEIVADFGLDPERPVLLQVSRFDPWKNQQATIDIWRRVRRQIPGVQLALVGAAADDDPEGKVVLADIQKIVEKEADVTIVANKASDKDVKAFKLVADVFLHPARREGFGLVVTESLWAGTPVVAAPVGGIPMQVRSDETGFLAGSVDEGAKATLQLLGSTNLRTKMAWAGHEHVRNHFLTPHMVAREISFMRDMLRSN